ncbi:MAG: protein kinase, partial [Chloroflexi bacterium]|nr:protein kinase [Chloroflexota bacterium]
MTFQEGENVGPYRVLHKLGQGGMATVFKAYHASLDRYVALKILHTAFMEDPNFLARFDREAKVVANLDHPNIIPIYDFSEHNGSPYFVMKFVTGNTLKALLKKRPLSQGEGKRIIETVGIALAYAHKQGILHRDIKPSNVMISDDDQIYLTDFGLARIASAGESTLSSDMMLGTPQYISPEQALGKRELDEGTDIYSFGVLVYELVVGQVPFSADTPYSIVHDHIYTPLPLPSSVNPSVPESVERVLLKALSKDREDRFENVDEFIKEFKAATHGEPLAEYWTDGQGAAAVAVPVPGSAAPSSSATQPPAESQTPAVEKPKRGFRWWYAIPLAIFMFLFLAIAGNVLDNRRSANAAAPTDPLLIAEADDPEGGEAFANGDRPFEAEADFPPLDFPPLDEEPLSPGLEEALILVEEHPEDPVAYLELAIAYFDFGHEEEAAFAYEQAQELAGENPDFYLLAAELFRQRDLWPLVLEATLKVISFA